MNEAEGRGPTRSPASWTSTSAPPPPGPTRRLRPRRRRRELARRVAPLAERQAEAARFLAEMQPDRRADPQRDRALRRAREPGRRARRPPRRRARRIEAVRRQARRRLARPRPVRRRQEAAAVRHRPADRPEGPLQGPQGEARRLEARRVRPEWPGRPRRDLLEGRQPVRLRLRRDRQPGAGARDGCSSARTII